MKDGSKVLAVFLCMYSSGGFLLIFIREVILLLGDLIMSTID